MTEQGSSSIEVFADIWCPFAHVGLRCARDQRDAHGRTDVLLHVRAWPLELVNGAPMDVSRTAAHIEELWHQIDPTLFAGFDPTAFPSSTIDALALVEHAYAVDPVLGERASFVVRDALFEEGRDISDPAVLADIAEAIGLPESAGFDREAVVASWHEGQQRGVKGSPHFFSGAGDMFCPSLDIARSAEGDMELALNVARLDAFLSASFDQIGR